MKTQKFKEDTISFNSYKITTNCRYEHEKAYDVHELDEDDLDALKDQYSK